MRRNRQIHDHPLALFRFILAEAEEGRQCVLATVAAVDGASSRAVGAHMVISEAHTFAGSISNGCVDADVVLQGLECLDEMKVRRVRYGEGSAYKDVKLPCGGAVEVLLTPAPELDEISAAIRALEAREAVNITLPENGERRFLTGHQAADHQGFTVRHAPPLRLEIVGRGEESIALARLSCAAHFDVRVCSPDEGVLRSAEDLGAGVNALQTSNDRVLFSDDQWTAIIFLFHDHDWEPPLIAQALETQAFYIGAMGSKVTQASRWRDLVERGIDERTVTRLRGPIGLVPSTRDPARLAISTLAEVIDADRLAVRA